MNGEIVDFIPMMPSHTAGDTIVRFRTANVIYIEDFYRNFGYPFADQTNGGSIHGMLEASGAAAEVTAAAVPLLPRARELAERGAIPGGTERNRASAAEWATFASGIGEAIRVLLADAQTSGGLLIAVAPERVGDLVAALQREGTPSAAVVGGVTQGGGAPGRVAVV